MLEKTHFLPVLKELRFILSKQKNKKQRANIYPNVRLKNEV